MVPAPLGSAECVARHEETASCHPAGNVVQRSYPPWWVPLESKACTCFFLHTVWTVLWKGLLVTELPELKTKLRPPPPAPEPLRMELGGPNHVLSDAEVSFVLQPFA